MYTTTMCHVCDAHDDNNDGVRIRVIVMCDVR